MKILLKLLVVVIVMSVAGCSDFLDVKPNKKLVVPQTLSDLQALLDDYNNIIADPTSGEISADNYYLDLRDWQSIFFQEDKQLYIWSKEGVIAPRSSPEWSRPYRNVYSANIVLDNLEEIKGDNLEMWNDVKGQALFLRARGFLAAVLLFAKPYNEETGLVDLGIPLRLSSDFNIISHRPSLHQTYRQIISDLEQAVSLLPMEPKSVYRASKPAAHALLARTYLYMGDYANCLIHADSCLNLKNELLDYNDLDPAIPFAIPELNKEILYMSIISALPLTNSVAKVDTTLYDSYQSGDLRREVFFRSNIDGSHAFRGSYYPSNNTFFSGLAVDEVYLMRAECYARSGEINKAVENLNTLLSHRWDRAKFTPINALDEAGVLNLILEERRKELLFRGLRWPDIKRLNLEGYNIALKRLLGEEEHILLPNDPRFILPIPDDVVDRTGMEQNER